MLISSQIVQDTEDRALVDVKISYTALNPDDDHLYRVIIDKITGHAVVHHDFDTKKTRVSLTAPDDKAELEEKAILCAICFPQE